MFKQEIADEFKVSGIESKEMSKAIELWLKIYQGNAPWVNPNANIDTIKFAKFICSEIARLVALDIDVSFDGKRKEYMQQFFDDAIKSRLREWIEYGCATGTVIIKPNAEGVDIVTPDRFEIVSTDGNGKITGIVFQDNYEEGKEFYTKLEYHKIWDMDVRMSEDAEYVRTTYYTIKNKAFKSKDEKEIGKPIDLSATRWAYLQPEVNFAKKNGTDFKGMLFGLLKMPIANEIDFDSPLGVAVFANAIKELKDLDVAYCRNTEEIYDSAKVVLVDDRLTQLPMTKNQRGELVRHQVEMPRYVKNVMSDDADSFYQEIVPSLNTQTRQEGINSLLSLIGTKCGFSNGYFVLDQKTGMVTATQVESDDRRTIQLIKDIRDALEHCLDDVFYAQAMFADLNNLAPIGDYEANYNFGDITYSYEEDKQTWWKYVQANVVPKWLYFVKFEGMSEEEAKAMVDEAQPKETGLFDE